MNKEIEDLSRLMTKPNSISRTLSNKQVYWEHSLYRSDDRNRKLKEIHNKRLKHFIKKIPASAHL